MSLTLDEDGYAIVNFVKSFFNLKSESENSLIGKKNIYHLRIKDLFYRWLDKSISEKDLIELKETLYRDNNKQWAPLGTNIIQHKTNCPQLCRYCYNIAWKHRSEKLEIPDIEDTREMFCTDENRVEKVWTTRKKANLYIFGSTHDIFPEMIDDYISVARKVIESGSELLIVTKPNLVCMKKLCKELKDLKDKIMIVCTITSNNKDLLEYWEPHAPSYKERVECLKYAFSQGYRTSVSMEPYLSDPREVIKDVSRYVTHYVWLGKMNHCKELEFDEEQYEKLDGLYDEEYVMRLIKDLRDNKKVFFKYSMMRTIGLTGKRPVKSK